MIASLLALVVDESKWLAFALVLSAATVGARLLRGTRPPAHLALLGAMNLFYALVIGIMASGHLLAVTVKLAQGTLRGSPWVLYPFGLALAVPAAWLAQRSLRPATEGAWRRRTALLNGSLALVLLALGLHNAPLAVPALLNVAYLFHTRRAVGWTILVATSLVNLGLLVGAFVFAASGQSFEQFSAEYEGADAGR